MDSSCWNATGNRRGIALAPAWQIGAGSGPGATLDSPQTPAYVAGLSGRPRRSPTRMHITVKGKQIEVGEALRGHVESALTAAVGKYFSNPLESQIVFTREAHLFRADISVHVGRSILIQGQAVAADAYAAGDAAVEHVAKRLRRHKRRLRDHHKNKDQLAALPASSPAMAYVFA